MGCHNEDDYEGDFSVETFKALMRGGESGPAVNPGDGDASPFIKSLTGRAKPKMPPKKEPQPAAEEIALLKAWIDSGAAGPAANEDQSMLATLRVPDITPAQGLARPVTAMEFSPDGDRLAVARYRSVEILDATSRKPLLTLSGHPGKVNAVHFSRDGSRIVTASGTAGLRGVATLWDASTGERIREFDQGHRDILYDAEFSPDGELLATAGYDRIILFRETASGEVLQRIDVHTGAVFDLAFSPDGAILASASADETVKLWKVATGQRFDTLNQPQGEQYSVAFTPDGKYILAAGADNRIRMWRLVSRGKPGINPLVHARFAHEDDIVSLAVSPGGRALISSSADRTLKLWSLPALAQAKVFEEQSDLAAALAMAPDGDSFVTGRMDGTIEAFPLQAARDALRKDGQAATAPVPADAVSGVSSAEAAEIEESEPNNSPGKANEVTVPAVITGVIESGEDTDLFRFHAKAGEPWVVEVNAARNKSPLDSKIEILHANGEPVERVVLQAVRDSWFTFRGKDSMTSDDFRVQNWAEMELNDYIYANGEVNKLWLYPRGPDSGFKVYPGFGSRHTYFGTSALAHPLGEPCYIVKAHPAGTEPSPNGLPVFRVFYENDDEPRRRWGDDSQVIFTAPEEADYLALIRDVRGFGGEDFTYALTIRPKQPDFKITVEGMNPAVSPGSGKEFTLKVERIDDFDGEIRIDVSGLPEGYTASTPVVIEAGHDMAVGVINAVPHAVPHAVAPGGDAAEATTKLTATAVIGGREVTRDAGTLGEITPGKPAKLKIEILPDEESGNVVAEPGEPPEFTIRPGETITARVVAERLDFKGQIELGKEDSGRNLAHGVYVDNIGLSGLLIVEGQDERKFFITAAPWVPDSTRFFFLRTAADGGHASRPAIIHVRGE